MNCSEVSSLLSLYLDEEIDDLRCKRVDSHVQKCPACSHDLATLAKTVRVIRFAAEREPEKDLAYIAHPSEMRPGQKSLMNRCNASAGEVKRRRTDE